MSINKTKLFELAWRDFRSMKAAGKANTFSDSLKYAWSAMKAVQAPKAPAQVKFENAQYLPSGMRASRHY